MKKMNLFTILISTCMLIMPTYANQVQAVEHQVNETWELIKMTEPIQEGFTIVDELAEDEVVALENTLAINNPEYLKREQGQERQYYTIVDGNYTATLSKDLQDWVYEMCSEYGISGYEKMIIAKLYCESSFNPNTIHTNKNGTKDYGIAQINSSNHLRLKNSLGITDFLDPYQSIRCGVFMISECLLANDYNESMALAAYNTGKNGISSTSYTRKVLRIKDTTAAHEF